MGKSADTITWYTRRLGQFKRFLESRGHSMLIADLQLEDGEAYVAKLMDQNERWPGHPNQKGHQGQKLSAHTIHGHVRALRALTHWAFDEHYLAEDLFARLPVPKLPKLMIQIFEDEEIERILNSINPATKQGARIRTMIILLLDTAIRADELLTLKVEDVHLDEGFIKVLGKGRKERIVPIGLTAKLHRWRRLARRPFPSTMSRLCVLTLRHI